MKSIDLFTGIGGQVRALHGIFTPVAYCEKRQSRIDILQRLIEKGWIPSAPIHTDVQTYSYSGNPEDVDIVVGSWPCIGFSSAGRLRGFEHAETALFREFVRIVKEIKPKFIYQENVPRVASSDAMDEVVQSLGEDYDLSWTVLPAYTIGAPHRRQRWYCFGVRKDIPDGSVTLTNLDEYQWFDWSREPCPRMTVEYNGNIRCAALGNAVVPDAARTAFLMLFSGFTVEFNQIRNIREVTLQRPVVDASKEFPKGGPSRYHGASRQGEAWTIRRARNFFPQVRQESIDFGFVLDPSAFSTDDEIRADANSILREPKKLTMWATPRGSALHPCKVLTERGAKDLPTQLRFERNTQNEIRGGRVNPGFVEFIMGFPQGWTESERNT